MEVNRDNQNKLREYAKQHREEGGNSAEAYGITQLIKDAILNKSYIVYNGGGPYNDDRETMFLKQYDVVVTFNFAGDPDFGVIIDEDLDFCDIYSSNEKGELLHKMY